MFPSRPSEAGRESGHNRIAGDSHDDGNRFSGLFQGSGCRVSMRHNDIYLETNQFGRKVGKAVELPSAHRYSIRCLSLDVAVLAQTLPEPLDAN